MLAKTRSIVVRSGALPGFRALPAQLLRTAGLHASAPAFGTPFHLPDIGEGIAEVEILQVFVKPGDDVEAFDPVMEVQSDKATVEISSRFSGKVESVHFAVGDIAPTGSVLMDIDEGENASGGSEAAQEAPAASDAAGAGDAPASSTPAAPAAATGGKALATPAVRRIARENNIDISVVPATGKGGRVLKSDILAFLKDGGEAPAAAPVPAPAAAAPAPAAPAEAAVESQPLDALPIAAGLVPEDRSVPLRGLRRAMVKSMNAAWEVPHFGYCDEVVLDAAMELRSAIKPIAEQKGLKFSYMPIIIKAVSLALNEFPELNAVMPEKGDELVVKGSHNIGIAMDTPRGLIVPNIKAVQSRSLLDVAHELNRLMVLAREGKLGGEDLADGTFSLSNIGAIGGTYASPVIMVPQVAIGALGKVSKLPRFAEDGSIEAVHTMNVSWAADHRVVDGATMARFSNLWKQYLENPTAMLAGMR